MNILLGLTGSVASTLAPKLVYAFQEAFHNVKVIASPNSMNFFRMEDVPAVPVYQDVDEWRWDEGGNDRHRWRKNDPILHIELRKWASAFVVAPASANKLAEMAQGLCPDLLTSVALAWDFCRPLVVAPAMNTRMWYHPATEKNLETLRDYGANVVDPVKKGLACNEEGMGAMADITTIVERVKEMLRWKFPLSTDKCSGIPVSHHPGAFGFHRKHSHHTGCDLYCRDGSNVYAVEAGRVVNVENFTGASDESPWWEETKAVLVEGPSGVVCYGEVEPALTVRMGDPVQRGQFIARVKRVLKPGKERPDIPGHSLSMLHVELYPHGTLTCSKSWKLEEHGTMCRRPEDLMDATPLLIAAEGAPEKRLSM